MSAAGRIDWTTIDSCGRCNEHGPFLPGGVLYAGGEDARDLHQSWHRLVAGFLTASRIPQVVRGLSRDQEATR